MVRRISSPVLIGRVIETRAFELSLEEARAGRSSIILLGGEAGSGKSRLLAEFAARARTARAAVVIGSAAPPAGEVCPPFAALTPVLRGLVRSLDARLIEPLLGDACADLAALLPELGPAPDQTDHLEPFGAARLAEAVLKVIEVVARHRSLVLIAIDDLQWTDEATRQLVMFLSRNVLEAPVILCLSYRNDALLRDEGLLAIVTELARNPIAERLDLSPLTADEVGEQIRTILGEEPELELVRALVRRSSGIPFFVEEILSAVIDGGLERPPPSVRVITESKLSRIDVEARKVVELIAVAGSGVPAAVVAAASGMEPSRFDRAVRDARDMYLIGLADMGHGPTQRGLAEHLDMRHELVREVIERSLTGPRRRELHARLADALEARSPSADIPRLERCARLALHRLLAGEYIQAVRALLEEAVEAEQVRSFLTAHEAYRRALDSWREVGDVPALADIDRIDVLEAAAQSAYLAGDATAAVAFAEEARSLRRVEPGAERQVRALLHLGIYQAAAGMEEAAIATLERAYLAASAGSRLRVRCGIELARRRVAAGRFDLAAGQATEAAADADRLEAGREARQARSVEAVALAKLGRVDDAHAVLLRARHTPTRHTRSSASLTRPSGFVAEVGGFLDRALALEHAGDPAAAAQVALEGRVMAERLGLSAVAGPVMAAVAARDLLRLGAWQEADAVLEPFVGDGRPDSVEVSLVRALLASRRGDRATATVDLLGSRRATAYLAQAGWLCYSHFVEAELAWRERRLGDARAAVSRAMATADDEADHLILAEAALLGIVIEADAIDALARGPASDVAVARETATRYWLQLRATPGMRETSGLLPALDAATLAAATAELARLEGRTDVSAWDVSVAAWERVPDRYGAACARVRLAEALVAGSSDRERARNALRAALVVADDLGCEPLAAQIDRFARRARLGALRPQEELDTALLPAGYAEARRIGLSEREIDVTCLLAEGMTDREIAGRLFISTKTAGHHVSHVLAKLGVSRRGGAAAVAYRIGLVPVSPRDQE
jgi:DNA-binding CsgD family transcriptional regulator